jgi:pimeloyl-ACP methyl ester carboxylesterase
MLLIEVQIEYNGCMSEQKNFSDFISPFDIDGMSGRMLNLPCKNPAYAKLELLFIYGHHSSIERNQGAVQLISNYGSVCMPDIPGFGGMDPFRKIGKKPDLDTYADYLAAFVRLRYGARKKFVLCGMSFGFLVVSRMLQKYPELHKRVVHVVSIVGFLSADEFVFSKTRIFWYTLGCRAVGSPPVAPIVRFLFFRKGFIRLVYSKTKNAKHKFLGLSAADRNRFVEFETKLWRMNDVQTHYQTNAEFLHCNLLKDRQLQLPLTHVAFSADQYFYGDVVSEHMKVAYSDVEIVKVESDSHAPSLIATEEEAKFMLPKRFIDILKGLA